MTFVRLFSLFVEFSEHKYIKSGSHSATLCLIPAGDC